MSKERIAELEREIGELVEELNALRKRSPGEEVPDYRFATLEGTIRLSELFGEHTRLLVIHNMGQGCRYCTLWADGFNGLLPHLESALGVVLVSRDQPPLQRRFAGSRGWRFRLASHGGGEYIREQTVMEGEENAPGAVLYLRDGKRVLRKNACAFGPGDLYCSMWSLLGLAGLGVKDWTPQYRYWRRPRDLEDGGANVLE